MLNIGCGAGIIHQNVDLPEGIDCFLYQGNTLGFIADIGPTNKRLTAGIGYARCRLLRTCQGISVINHDPGTQGRQLYRQLGPDA